MKGDGVADTAASGCLLTKGANKASEDLGVTQPLRCVTSLSAAPGSHSRGMTIGKSTLDCSLFVADFTICNRVPIG